MKKILITGCSTGFGFDAAKYFAEKGQHVLASMRNVNSKNAGPAAELNEFARANNYKLDVFDIDVTSDASVAAVADQLQDVDVLINNAGVGFGGAMESFTSTEMIDQLDLNIVGTIRVSKAVLPGMRSRKSGLIIQVSSTAGRAAFPGWGLYNASKWGLEGMSEAMRYELAPLGIDVVLVEPGPFATSFLGNIVPSTDAEVASAYAHVDGFMEGFGKMVKEVYADENAPTDPMIVVKIWEDLINMAPGTRPMRTIAGLDFGFQALNDATEPIRKGGLEGMGLSDWDGPKG